MKRIFSSTVFFLVLGAGGIACGGSDFSARDLFGITDDPGLANSQSPAVACASEIAVTTTQIELVEDGDVTRTYNTADPFYTDVGGIGGSFVSVETCIYPMQAFTGTLTVPLSTNGTYAGRINVQTSFPVAGSPLPTSLTFTTSGVAARQCFTFARVQDAIQNPAEAALRVNLDPITSADDGGVYLNKNACDIAASVEDDESPGVRVSSISRVMEEPGGTGDTSAQFLVRLRTAPVANVTIPINDIYDATNAGRREGTATPTSLTFTPANFAVEQAVTINSADDLEVDGTKVYTVEVQSAISTDPIYSGFKPRNVVVVNNDKSVPGYTYTRWDTVGGSTGAAGGNVTGFATDQQNNMGTTYSTWQIQMRSKPASNVQLNFTTDNTAISTVLTPTLTFTPSNWNVPQTVQVEGKSNGTDGANVDFTVSFTTTTTDTTYNTLARPTFTVRSCDNDGTHEIHTCNFSGAPLGTSGNRLSGAEPSATTQIWLITKSSPPSAATVTISSTDTSEGTVAASVTIDSGNYNRMTAGGTNRIALAHQDDTLLDGSQNWTVTTDAATGGLTYNPVDVFATTTDNEQKYYTTTTGSTNEDDTVTATISVCLGASNTEAIEITPNCPTDECGSISPTSQTFSVGQTVSLANASNSGCASDANRVTFTVHGADDTFADGSQNFSVTWSVTANTDPVYSTGAPANQTISNADNENPGKAIFVTSTSFVGEMTAAGVGGADNFCQTGRPAHAPTGTYKALIVSDSATGRRIATTDGSTSAGQTGWVLSASYHYYRCSASGAANCSDEFSRLFIATSAGLIPFAMDRNFSTNLPDEFWTGMNANMTAATQSSTPAGQPLDPAYRDNCAGWTYQNAPESPNPTYYGQTWTYGGSTGTVTSITNVACTNTRKLICVQQ